MEEQNNLIARIDNNDIGHLTLGKSLVTSDTRAVRKCFSDFEEKDIKQIIVDMSEVRNIDSSGVGMLVMYLKRQRNKNGNLKLLSPRYEVLQILKLVNVYPYFEII